MVIFSKYVGFRLFSIAVFRFVRRCCLKFRANNTFVRLECTLWFTLFKIDLLTGLWGMPTCPLSDTFLVQVLMYIAVLRTADAIKVSGRLECAFGYLFVSFHLHLRFSATLVQLPLIKNHINSWCCRGNLPSGHPVRLWIYYLRMWSVILFKFLNSVVFGCLALVNEEKLPVFNEVNEPNDHILYFNARFKSEMFLHLVKWWVANSLLLTHNLVLCSGWIDNCNFLWY